MLVELLTSVLLIWILIYFFFCPFGNLFLTLFDGNVSGNFLNIDDSNQANHVPLEYTIWMSVATAIIIFINLFPDALGLVFCCWIQISKKTDSCPNVLKGLLILSANLRPFSYIIFFEVIGKEVGIAWSDLTFEGIFILSVDSITFFVFLGTDIYYLISWIRKITHSRKYQVNIKMTGGLLVRRSNLRTLKYKKRFRPYKKRETYKETKLFTENKPEPTVDCDFGIKKLITELWEPAKVGIGKDAQALRHKRISISKIDYIGNAEILYAYNEKRRRLTTSALTYSKTGSFYSLVDYGNTTPDIATRLKCPHLDAGVDNRLNECYLFHGTPKENVSSIAREGFRLPTLARMLGSGIYFTDSPVKADQYTGRGDTGVIILSRVLLGNAALTKAARVYNVDDMKGGSVRKMMCCFLRNELPNHSIIYDGGLFREYVVYESCLAFPEFAIYYRRENDVSMV